MLLDPGTVYAFRIPTIPLRTVIVVDAPDLKGHIRFSVHAAVLPDNGGFDAGQYHYRDSMPISDFQQMVKDNVLTTFGHVREDLVFVM